MRIRSMILAALVLLASCAKKTEEAVVESGTRVSDENFELILGGVGKMKKQGVIDLIGRPAFYVGSPNGEIMMYKLLIGSKDTPTHIYSKNGRIREENPKARCECVLIRLDGQDFVANAKRFDRLPYAEEYP